MKFYNFNAYFVLKYTYEGWYILFGVKMFDK